LLVLAGVERHEWRAALSGAFGARKGFVIVCALLVTGASAFSMVRQVRDGKFSVTYAPQPLFKGQVADERSFYNQSNGLRAMLNGSRVLWLAEGAWVRERLTGQKALIAKRNVGMFGYSAGPQVFIVDLLSLGNPFLSRLPSCLADRPGHFVRPVPAGYGASLAEGRNLLQDPLLARLMDDVVLATRAPLTAPGRIRAIWRLNSGTYREPGQMSRYAAVPGGVFNLGVDPGNESRPCPKVANGARTDLLARVASTSRPPPWLVPTLAR
jgi:arabinofuranosyltransferase